MSQRNGVFLDAMGLGPRWVLRDGAVAAAGAETVAGVQDQAVAYAAPAPAVAVAVTAPVAAAPVPAAAPQLPFEQMNWAQLEQAIADLAASAPFEGHGKPVFGAGDRNANWLFIGAAPNAEDEAAGLPLAGKRGHLFSNMLLAMGLRADENVYLTTLLKSRPPQDAASAADIAAWRPCLERELSLLQPTMVVALGAEVAGALLNQPSASLSGLRGAVHQYAGLPLVVTYDPADLLHTPAAKAGAWADLCLAMSSDAARH